MESIVLYIKESYNELVHKVTWPSMESLLESTRLVLIGTIIFSLIVFIMDAISKGLITSIYDLNF